MPTCPRCKEEKTNENFSKNKRNKNGLSTYCKPCSSSESIRWKKENPDKDKQYQKQYQKGYYQENRVVLMERSKNRYQQEKLRHGTVVNRWKISHPDEWKVSHRAGVRRRRARKRGIPGNHTAKQFLEVCRLNLWKCAYCDCDLTIKTVEEDHVIPISRPELNPTDFINNIVPACFGCNTSKGNRTPDEWFAHLDEIQLTAVSK